MSVSAIQFVSLFDMSVHSDGSCVVLVCGVGLECLRLTLENL